MSVKSIDKPGVVGDLKSSVNGILGLRDSLGAALTEVYIVQRTWSGNEIGEGTATEVETKVIPSPRILSFSDDSRVMQGGAIQLDDIKLKMISKVNYPKKSDVDCTVSSQKIEKFYLIDGQIYSVTSVEEKHLYWNVMLRKRSNQKRYNV